MKRLAIVFTFALLAGCKSGTTAPEAKTPFDPCEILRKVDPHCGWSPHWNHLGGSTNAIDGTKTEFLSLDSSDPDGMATGRMTYAELRICFENGKLCGHKAVGAGVTVDGMVQPISYESNYSTSVRVKFDDEKAVRQTWGISADHVALFPYGREKQFLIQLLQHKKLILEFSYYEKAPETVTFELADLGEKMKLIGIDPQTVIQEQEAAKQAKEAANRAGVEAERAKRAKISEQIYPCKERHEPIPMEASKKMFCWDPHDGSPERGPFATREEAIEMGLHGYY